MWKPNKGRRGDQFLHKKPEEYRKKAMAKIEAYHRFIQLAIIGHGILLHLAINFRRPVWGIFPSLLRTSNINEPPSESVVAQTLKFRLPEFLLGSHRTPAIRKILRERIDVTKMPGMGISA